jgi:hypothetical protein
MPDILIRDVPEDVARALTEKALRDGTMDRQAWLRKKLIELATMPTVRSRYSFKAVSENGAYVTINRRYADGHVQRGAKNCSQEQFDAYQRACDYVERNELGDYEAAYKLLVQHFDEVFPS